MRYGLWAIVIILLVILITISVRTIQNEFSSNVPQDYNFSVTDLQNKNIGITTIYYVYSDHIIVERISQSENNSVVKSDYLIYENINTSSLVYDETAVDTVCDSESCQEIPKVIAKIKKLLNNKASREYN